MTESPGLSGRFMVTALPTIFHVKNGEFRQYRGSRDKDSFITFIEEKKYEEMELIPGWKSPDSVQMTAVSYFFKMSMLLRNAHQIITEDYGYSNWVSYVVFAVATIVFGALLGVILVCCVDCIFPYKAPHQHHHQHQHQVAQKAKDSDNEDDEGDQDKDDDEEQEQEEEQEDKSPSVRKRKPKKAD